MKRTLPVFFCIMLFASLLHGQDVTGIILDKQTGEALIGATVAVKGTTVGTTTDIDGKFSFKITQSPPFTLTFSYVGYTVQEVDIKNAADLKRTFNIKLALKKKY